MLAGGSGITPIYAMINEVLRTAATDTISLLFVNHHYSRIIFRDELESLQATSNGRFTVDHILSDAGGVPEGFRPFSVGRPGKLVVKSWLRARRTPAPAEEYYLCGPHGLLNVFDQALQQSGIAPTQIAKEHFFVPEAGQPTPLFPQQTVALRWHKQTKKVVVPSGTTILQAALHAGISAPFSCQKGQCGTCTARLVEGNVHMSHNYALSGEQLQEGLVLLCQSHPTTENVTLELAI
jgi:ring-1,2-phenylacetyl-CoA epoxidase subunit PaaE